MILNVSVYLTI